MPYIIGMLLSSASSKQAYELKCDLHFVTVGIFEEQIRLAPTELTLCP